MGYKRTPDEVLRFLKREQISTWFELGLFIDRLREERDHLSEGFTGDFSKFEKKISRGIAFITYQYSIDGVTIEVGKYARLIKQLYPDSGIHYISGVFKNDSKDLIPEFVKKHQISEIKGFDDWKLYRDFYFTRLERGSPAYNKLITDLWNEVLIITEKLGRYIFKEGLELLYIINLCSNPGNVSLSLALVLLSELMGIPVINNNHDFYWEGGSSRGLVAKSDKLTGPRDFFFTNAHLGEVFSLIEMIYPWEARNWINVNINRTQTEHLIRKNGLNPANVMQIGTAVDTGIYRNIDKRLKIDAFFQFEKILSRYKKKLVGYSVDDAIKNKLVDKNNPKPILIGNKTRAISKFNSENIIFLQPTRIISRKRIEIGFSLLLKIVEDENFMERLLKTKKLKITILITGPIAPGHYNYFEKLLKGFQELINEIPKKLRNRVYLALLFSEHDQESFKERFTNPFGLPELYNIASLILLPSKTEGRGLPIIEATACGIPIFCSRYDPENVYAEVIGEHLGEQDRLKVIEYDGKEIPMESVNHIIERVMFPHKFTEEINHNRRAVLKRYSFQALKLNLKEIVYRLYLQTKTSAGAHTEAKKSFEIFKSSINTEEADFKYIMNTKNRQYLPGFGKLGFMIYLKSLIDPSFFRIEEKEFRGRAFHFAREILKKDKDQDLVPLERKLLFFNSVESLFLLRDGEIQIRHDHSFTYRHRNKNYYPNQDYTIQEIYGLINILYFSIINPTVINNVYEAPHFFTDWNLALLQLTGSNNLGIDNRKKLIKKLKLNIPIAYFPGEYLMHELEFFALQAIRSRLKLPIEIALDREILMENKDKLEKVYIFSQEKNLGRQLNLEETKEYILKGENEELRLLHEFNILQLIPTTQWTVGIHFAQLGKEALKILRVIKDKKGFIISNRRNSVIMTDIVDIDKFHIGKVRGSLVSEMLGIPMQSGYIQYVPAGIRTCLAYPTPIQTAKDFDKALKSKQYKTLCKKYGEERILTELKKDAEEKSSPVCYVLDKLWKEGNSIPGESVEYEFISGIYNDHNPYNGVLATIRLQTEEGIWNFSVLSATGKPTKVTDFVSKLEKKIKTKARVAWNGGYILNPELVGKLGLPESYIGSPLGLIISNREILSPPLFNKAALLIHEKGGFSIKRINCSKGMKITLNTKVFESKSDNYNPDNYSEDFCYYDLRYDKEFIPGNGRVIIRLAGTEIKEIIQTKKGENVKMIPVGLSLSFKNKSLIEGLSVNEKVKISIQGLEGILHAVEAGPQLLENGKECIDMKKEGWKTQNSINTQAARLDYTDMRGPKIAAGIDRAGNLSILAINGRIRESVGASHHNMAEILQKRGIKTAMGFDPGGSSTLFVNGKVINISPYNSRYEENIHSLPPEPRAVSNAIIGYIKKANINQ